MIKFNEIKQGNHVLATFDGDIRRGEVEEINSNEKQVCVNTGAQGFWFDCADLTPIQLNDEELQNFKFHKEVKEDGTVKYLKGAFRMIIPKEGDFSRLHIWYRDEERNIMEAIPLHVFQNHFYEMTKVFLNEGSFD